LGLRVDGEDHLYSQFYARYSFRDCVRRYVDYDWNRLIAEGIFFGDHNDNDRALQSLTAGLRAEPNSAAGWDMFGRVLERLGRREEAVSSARRACELEPSDPYFAVNLSYTLLASGDADGAETALRNALELNPDFPELTLTLSHLLAKRQKIPAAIEAAQRALTFSARVLTILPHLARLFVSCNDFEQAAEMYRRALGVRPHDAALHFDLADVLWKAGDHAGAIQECSEAIRLAPSELRYRIFAAEFLLKAGRLEEALAMYREVLRIDPRERSVHEALAHLYVRLGDVETAITHCYAALDQHPENPALLVHLGNQLEAAGRLAGAASCFVDALIIDHRAAHTHFLLSRNLAKQGKITEAICAAMNASNLEPEDEVSRHHLADLIAMHKSARGSQPGPPATLP
jgi:tetratricopeptide (TPR) repeat protein